MEVYLRDIKKHYSLWVSRGRPPDGASLETAHTDVVEAPRASAHALLLHILPVTFLFEARPFTQILSAFSSPLIFSDRSISPILLSVGNCSVGNKRTRFVATARRIERDERARFALGDISSDNNSDPLDHN